MGFNGLEGNGEGFNLKILTSDKQAMKYINVFRGGEYFKSAEMSTGHIDICS